MSFEACRPVGQVMDLVQQQDGCAVLCARFCLHPTALQEAGEGGVRLIACHVDGCVPELSCQVQQERGFAHLPWSRKELNAPGRRLPQSLLEQATAVAKVVLKFNHSLIIIRL